MDGQSEHNLMRLYDRVGKLSASLYHELSTLRSVSVDRRDAIDLMRQENAKLKQRNQDLEEQLQECQARILKFTLSSDLSDTTVLQEFVKIRDNLSNWVEGLPEICTGFDTHLECALKEFQCYLHIVGGINSYPQGVLEVQSELLMHVVFCRLEVGLLKASVPGMLASDEALLSDLDAGMVSLQSKKDIENLNLWKTNTIRAYVACQRYERGVNEEYNGIIDKLYNLFTCFDFEHHVNWNNKMERLRDDILEPAASLATKMSSSPSRYRWEWYHEAHFPQRVVRKYHLELFIVQDARTHNRIPIANVETLPDETAIGELLVIVFPALFRCADSGHEEIQIEKAVILVRANEDLQRQKRSEDKPSVLGKTVPQTSKDSALGRLN
ncbi:similar to An16g05280 [Aspergillus luchuensis IFO 4308]|nr:similar to An16g05280 [Aspergillus luchuensis IFO 4308]